MFTNKILKRRNIRISLFVLGMIMGASYIYIQSWSNLSQPDVSTNQSPRISTVVINSTSTEAVVNKTQSGVVKTDIASSTLVLPLTDALSRITKKPFGIKVSPNNSPVFPEKFSGYHTGVDFETTPEEANTEVPVYANCSGKLIFAHWAADMGERRSKLVRSTIRQ